MTSNIATIKERKTRTSKPKQAKERFSISLSQSSAQAFEELKELTGADTDSEVFRNALRMHRMLLRAHMDGKRFLIHDEGNNSTTPLNLFIYTE
ncbi:MULTISPECIES: ribbon-helix-helix protein, CopG family [unclassified Lentilitoribacter]|uniref:ribbon-helix-helix protein, CopG family n=1 Tax=unclassified Lentilitoribacter TaxID=2647570 RepID=UPI0013A6E403|nr:ribbon-helix-helix protein, CopG family [Lentilitoribacter sp. Alg239-R112]